MRLVSRFKSFRLNDILVSKHLLNQGLVVLSVIIVCFCSLYYPVDGQFDHCLLSLNVWLGFVDLSLDRSYPQNEAEVEVREPNMVLSSESDSDSDIEILTVRQW